MSYHNSISGYESKMDAVPKEIVESFTDYLKENDIKRPVLRLIKHFIKNAGSSLNITDHNRLPSIAIMLLAFENYRPFETTVSEETLYREVSNFISLCDDKLVKERIKDLSYQPLLIYNTLFKITDYTEVYKVIKEVKNQLISKNYAQLVSGKVFEAVRIREGGESSPSILGTMGSCND